MPIIAIINCWNYQFQINCDPCNHILSCFQVTLLPSLLLKERTLTDMNYRVLKIMTALLNLVTFTIQTLVASQSQQTEYCSVEVSIRNDTGCQSKPPKITFSDELQARKNQQENELPKKYQNFTSLVTNTRQT